MISVLVISPYEDLVPDCQEMVEALRSDEIDFTTTCLYGTRAELLGQFHSYDIIVARGMTYYALCQMYPDRHLIEIMMTTSDVLDSLYEAQNLYGKDTKIGIVLANDSMCSLTSIKALTGLDIYLEAARNEKEIQRAVNSLCEKGVSVFIGGMTLDAYLSEEHKNIKHIPLHSSRDTMKRAIEDAANTAKSLYRERMRSSLLEKVIDSLPYCLFCVRQDGTISLANGLAEEFFSKESLVGEKINSIYPSALLDMVESDSMMEIVQTVNNQEMYIQQQKLSDSGAVIITMQRASIFHDAGKLIKSSLRVGGLNARYHFSDIIAESIVMKQLIAKAVRYAQSESNVLVTGETGTGKELFVQSMHNASKRADGPFVAVNCSAISEDLLESELFGYSEGAFTGAKKGGKVGLFELADGGTIFLDEIGELPMQHQAKLLRTLQEKEIMRVGGDDVVPIDVRVICATNQNIPELIEKGLFRRDLYYRINLLMIHIPPLRERLNDIGPLFRHFVKLYAERMSILSPPIDISAINELQRYSWRGNIRELRNVAERLIALNGHDRITARSLKTIDMPENDVIAPAIVKSDEIKTDIVKWQRGGDYSGLYDEYLASGLSLSEFSSRIGISRTTLWRYFKTLK